MNPLVEKLLQPVSAEQPCGPDLSNDPAFDELETILKGKPEVEIGTIKKPAEPPDWRELKDKSAQFLSRSRNLRVAMMHCCSLLRTGGLPGFRDGLQLVRGLAEQFWPTVYPLLDPEDNNDPTQRLNILAALTAERGSLAAGWLSITDYLYAAPACQPKGMPPITFDQILATRQKTADGTPAPDAPDPAKLGAAVRAAGSEPLAVQQQVLQETIETLHGLDQFLTTTLGAGGTISFDVLERTLRDLLGAIEPYITAGAGEGGAVATIEAGGAEVAAGAITIHGSIRSRDDVVRALDTICEYYQQVEPSSPVPYLLRRAQKLAAMDFIQAVQELNLTTIDGLRPSMGSAVDSAAPPPA